MAPSGDCMATFNNQKSVGKREDPLANRLCFSRELRTIHSGGRHRAFNVREQYQCAVSRRGCDRSVSCKIFVRFVSTFD